MLSLSPFCGPEFELHLSPFGERGSVPHSPPHGVLQGPPSDLRYSGHGLRLDFQTPSPQPVSAHPGWRVRPGWQHLLSFCFCNCWMKRKKKHMTSFPNRENPSYHGPKTQPFLGTRDTPRENLLIYKHACQKLSQPGHSPC